MDLVELFTKVSVACPRCHTAQPGERGQVGDRVVTLCYCNSCGLTWTRDGDTVGPRAPKPPDRTALGTIRPTARAKARLRSHFEKVSARDHRSTKVPPRRFDP